MSSCVCVSKCMQAHLTPSVSGVKVNSIITFLPAYKTACECLALFFLLYFTTTFSFVQFANGVHTHTHAVQNWRRLTFCNKEKVAKKEEKWTNERTKGGRKEQHQLNVHTHTHTPIYIICESCCWRASVCYRLRKWSDEKIMGFSI